MGFSPYGVECPHCNRVEIEGVDPWPYCGGCGHRADLPRLVCTCKKCLPAECVLRGTEDDGEY